jgi:hypothetical protein
MVELLSKGAWQRRNFFLFFPPEDENRTRFQNFTVFCIKMLKQ